MLYIIRSVYLCIEMEIFLMGSPNIFFLQLNEINFDYIDRYIDLGYLPNFSALFEKHGYVETTSETEHHLANPWIQWADRPYWLILR